MYENIKLDPNVFKVAGSLRCLLIGASQSGKSTFIKNMVRYRHLLFRNVHQKIIYISPNLKESVYLGNEEKFVTEMRQLSQDTPIDFFSEIPKIEDLAGLINGPEGKILIFFDDFQSELWDSPAICSAYTRLSSHQGLDLVATSHTGFSKGRFYSTVFKQCNLIILFRTLSDRSLNTYMNTKIFPGKPGVINACFDAVLDMCGPFSYLAFGFDISNILHHRFPIMSRLLPYVDSFGELKHRPLFFALK